MINHLQCFIFIPQIVDGEFCCSVCGKKCKSKGGLTRHKRAKHEADTLVCTSESNENGFTIEVYCQLVNQSAKSLSEDECYPESIRKEFETYVFNVLEEDYQAANERFAQIKMLYTSVKRKGNVEKFYSKYFALVPLKATEYFPGLPFQLSVLLATKVANKIISFCKDNDSNSMPAEERVTARDLTEKEKAALQYLGGYVLFALNKRIRQSKKWQTKSSQQVLSVLQAGKQSDSSNTAQKLVDSVNRGGLWKINPVVEQLFTIAELHFKNVTSGGHITRISKENIVSILEKNHEVVSLFDQWVTSAELEVSKNVSEDILHQALMLYVKVRSFSFAKDVINKYKAQKKSSKSKALRTDLKRTSDQPTVLE